MIRLGQVKVSFQDELLQQLDEALGQQQQEILLLKSTSGALGAGAIAG